MESMRCVVLTRLTWRLAGDVEAAEAPAERLLVVLVAVAEGDAGHRVVRVVLQGRGRVHPGVEGVQPRGGYLGRPEEGRPGGVVQDLRVHHVLLAEHGYYGVPVPGQGHSLAADGGEGGDRGPLGIEDAGPVVHRHIVVAGLVAVAQDPVLYTGREFYECGHLPLETTLDLDLWETRLDGSFLTSALGLGPVSWAFGPASLP
jgi:hypothetical protein